MHFYESSMITTKDGLHCQVYSNEHPEGKIIVKPKYIPTDKISSKALPSRFIYGAKVNRLNHWADKKALTEYIKSFSKAYPQYILKSDVHDNSPLFFAVPKECIEKVYYPKEGVKQLMGMQSKDLDSHLKKVYDFISFLLKSGIGLENIGITYSTIMGYYSSDLSDINIVIYGKNNYWKMMDFLKKVPHKDLKWKSYEEWGQYYSKRNRKAIHDKNIYLKKTMKKRSEGFFRETLFVIFAVEEPNETWFKWGEEKYKRIGFAKFRGKVKDNKNSIVRPGMYEIEDSNFIEGDKSCKKISIKKAVFHSRDYCMFADIGDTVEISGVVERVSSEEGEYYRIVLGYMDSFLSDRRDMEYIKVVNGEDFLIKDNVSRKSGCNLCKESFFKIGEPTGYGKVVCKVGGLQNGWFATLSPKTGGDVKRDFTIQIMPFLHLTHFSQIASYPGLAENYGIIFSKVCRAMTAIMIEDGHLKTNAGEKELAISIGTYGKSTTWKEKKEHLHIKIFPFRGAIGQPYTVDSSFEKKQVYTNSEGMPFVAMEPVSKKYLEPIRFNKLANRLIALLA